jgi:hypothetical protein
LANKTLANKTLANKTLANKMPSGPMKDWPISETLWQMISEEGAGIIRYQEEVGCLLNHDLLCRTWMRRENTAYPVVFSKLLTR